MTTTNDMLSIVIPVSERYDEPAELFTAYHQAITGLGMDHEFIYVLDGLFPDTRRTLEELQTRGYPIRLLQLSRGFGEATALTAGFQHARGGLIMTLPAYFQVTPETLPKLLEALEDNDMVVARRWPRTDSGFNRLQTRLFNRLLGFLTGAGFRDLGCGVRLMRREVAASVPIYGDQHRFLPVLASRYGYRAVEVDLPQSQRDSYRRVYRPGVYPRRVLDMLTVFFLIKFTKKPLRFFGLIGTSTAALGGLILLAMVVERMLFGTALGDRPLLLLASLMVVLGVQVFGLGLIGELIIFTHAKDIKEYAVREVVNGDTADGDDPPATVGGVSGATTADQDTDTLRTSSTSS